MKNGDTWAVHQIGGDGSLAVRREADNAHVVLPAGYVRRHVELGYAATAHRAQGRTVDTAHALVDAMTTRETLYVSATRGRSTNTIYVDTAADPDIETSHDNSTTAHSDEVLERILARTTSDTSAHTALGREREMVQAMQDREAVQRNAFASSLQQTSYRHDHGSSRAQAIGL